MGVWNINSPTSGWRLKRAAARFGWLVLVLLSRRIAHLRVSDPACLDLGVILPTATFTSTTSWAYTLSEAPRLPLLIAEPADSAPNVPPPGDGLMYPAPPTAVRGGRRSDPSGCCCVGDQRAAFPGRRGGTRQAGPGGLSVASAPRQPTRAGRRPHHW